MTELYYDSDDENAQFIKKKKKKIDSIATTMKDLLRNINPVVSSFADESKDKNKKLARKRLLDSDSSDEDKSLIVNKKLDFKETSVPQVITKDFQDESLDSFLRKFRSPITFPASHVQIQSSDNNDDFMEEATIISTSVPKQISKKIAFEDIEKKTISNIERKAIKLKDMTDVRIEEMRREEAYADEDVVTHAIKPYHPTRPPCRPCVPMELVDKERKAVTTTYVPGPASRYLMPHQVLGVQWLWSKYCMSEGCILADDMGLGKTIQIMALMLAVQGKSGMEETDKPNNRRRRKGEENQPGKEASPYLPCLVVCPKSVIGNWRKELDTWGYFLVDVLSSSGGTGVSAPEDILALAEKCRTDVVVCTYDSLIKHQTALASISWAIIAYDEGHEMKNAKSQRFEAAVALKQARLRVILSGTPVQNKIEELWCLLAVVSCGKLVGRKEFINHFVNPIKRAKSSMASAVVKELGSQRQKELIDTVVNKKILRRLKEDVLSDVLKGKDDMIVFCELSPLQTALYKHMLALPDFDNDRYSTSPCPCGSGEKRGMCCQEQYKAPYLRVRADGSDYINKLDPRAVIWRIMHEGDIPCSRCPHCVTFACLNKLLKCVAHPSLLQADPTPYPKDHVRYEADMAVHRFATEALSPELLAQLGGPRRSTELLQAARLESSGKLKTLDKLLCAFTAKLLKTLVFSQSTQMLDIIESYVRANGWKYVRLDGSTQEGNRQKLVNAFNNERTILVFLISTKAGGLGLNLTSSCKVVIFDCSWNPAYDLQAQDRAYRIGQNQRVTVYRLVAQGTVEEMTYMRQLYKQGLQQATTDDSGDTAGQFEGIQGDAQCQGELFGIENLLQHEEGGSILARLRRKYIDSEEAEEQMGGVGGLSSMKTADVGRIVARAKEEGRDDEKEALLDIATHRNTDLLNVPVSKPSVTPGPIAAQTPIAVAAPLVEMTPDDMIPQAAVAESGGEGHKVETPIGQQPPKKRTLPPSIAASVPALSTLNVYIPKYGSR